jgi:hypothetical protein
MLQWWDNLDRTHTNGHDLHDKVLYLHHNCAQPIGYSSLSSLIVLSTFWRVCLCVIFYSKPYHIGPFSLWEHLRVWQRNSNTMGPSGLGWHCQRPHLSLALATPSATHGTMLLHEPAFLTHPRHVHSVLSFAGISCTTRSWTVKPPDFKLCPSFPSHSHPYRMQAWVLVYRFRLITVKSASPAVSEPGVALKHPLSWYKIFRFFKSSDIT